MKLTLETPTKLYIDDATPSELKSLQEELTYTDTSVAFELKKFQHATWYANKFGPEAYASRLAELQASQKVCLLSRDGSGRHYVNSGLLEALKSKYGCTVTNKVVYPEPKNIPWAVVPDRTPYPYQIEARDRLLEAKHARVELATGTGKSFCALLLVKALGLKTVIMTPSESISEQLYDDFVLHFGKKYVGKFYKGKKEAGKLFVVGTGQSLTRVEVGTKEWEDLSKCEVFITDESHTIAAQTFCHVALGVMANAPYRFNFSATQIRGDGSGKLLDSLTGHTVLELTVRQGVDGGYLAKPVFFMVPVQSHVDFESADPNEMTRKHFFYSPEVLKRAAAIANQSVAVSGHSVLILIDEVAQFTELLPHLQHEVRFAHGPLADNKSKVPEKYHDCDNKALVKAFNASEFPILIGTSCISTGTDFKSVKTMIYLRGGKSEVEVRQGVGRTTRIFKPLNKTSCNIIDFDVTNIRTVHAHALARKRIFEDIYGPVKMVKL